MLSEFIKITKTIEILILLLHWLSALTRSPLSRCIPPFAIEYIPVSAQINRCKPFPKITFCEVFSYKDVLQKG